MDAGLSYSDIYIQEVLDSSLKWLTAESIVALMGKPKLGT